MSDTFTDKMKSELLTWRTRLDELQVKSGLARLEARDKRDEWLAAFDQAYHGARRQLAEAKSDATDDLAAARLSLEAGWEELRRTWNALRAEDTTAGRGS